MKKRVKIIVSPQQVVRREEIDDEIIIEIVDRNEIESLNKDEITCRGAIIDGEFQCIGDCGGDGPTCEEVHEHHGSTTLIYCKCEYMGG